MNDLLQDFGTYFGSENLLTGMFVGYDHMPENPPACIGIYEYMGDSGLPQVAGVLRSIQIVVRDVSAQVARRKANDLYNALDVEDGILNLTTERWCAIQLRQSPFKFKVDNKQLVYYAFNVGVNTFND